MDSAGKWHSASAMRFARAVLWCSLLDLGAANDQLRGIPCGHSAGKFLDVIKPLLLQKACGY